MRDFEFEGEDNYFEAMDYMARITQDEEHWNAKDSRSAVRQEDIRGHMFGDLDICHGVPRVLRDRDAP